MAVLHAVSGSQIDNDKKASADGISRGFAVAIAALGLGLAIYSAALMIRAYVPCPYWDEWKVLADLARGAKPWSLSWLWSQQSEHRIVIPRLLIWLDLRLFGGKNISLFVEMYAIQLAEFFAIWFVLERLEQYPKPVKRTLQGLFAVCIFHPNQVQNFTWAFQVDFVLPFAIGTIALLWLAYCGTKQAGLKVVVPVGFAPILAAFNLASGLLIGPALVLLGVFRQIPRRALIVLAGLSGASIVFYLAGYTNPDRNSPILALQHPLDIAHYVLNLLGTTWALFPHLVFPTLSVVAFAALTALALRHRKEVTNFEWFCITECTLMLLAALMTASGRLKYGVAQAAESRYQTAAMLYWASLFSLMLIAVWRRGTRRTAQVQLFVLLVAGSSLISLPHQWSEAMARSREQNRACALVMTGNYDEATAKELAPEPTVLEQGAKLLRGR